MRITSQKLPVLALVIVAAIAVPAASATTLDIQFGGSTVGTVTLTQGTSMTCGGAANVCVTVSMNSGFAVDITNGGQIGFDTKGGLTLSGSSFTSFSGGPTGLSPKCTTCEVGGLGKFAFNFNPTGAGGSDNFTGSLSFVILNATATDITSMGFHLCVAGASVTDTTACTKTDFGATVPSTPTVPEPGTLGLLGTGLIGIAGLVRRRSTR